MSEASLWSQHALHAESRSENQRNAVHRANYLYSLKSVVQRHEKKT